MAEKKFSQNFLDSVLGDDQAIADDSFEADQASGSNNLADQAIKAIEQQNGQQPPQQKTLPPPREQDRQEPAQVKAGAASPPSIPSETTDTDRQELLQLRQQKEKWDRFDERVRVIREQQALQQQETARQEQIRQQQAEAEKRAKERPDPLIDPVGAQMFDINEQVRQQQQLIQSLSDQIRQGNVQTQQNSLQTWTNNEFAFARTRHTDFDAAVEYLRGKEVSELNSLGIMDPQVINAHIQQKVNWAASMAAQNGISLGEALYARATALGYQAGAKPAPAQPQASVTVPVQRQQPSSSAQKLDQIRKGQALAGMGRTPSAPQAQPTQSFADYFDSLSDEDVARLAASPEGAKFLQMYEQWETGTLQ